MSSEENLQAAAALTADQDAALAEEVKKIQQEVAQMEQKMDELEKRNQFHTSNKL